MDDAKGYIDEANTGRQPLYRKSFDEAYDLGETRQYHADRELNIKCGHAVAAAIAENFDGYHLKHGISDAVIRQFGLERVKYVVASSVQLKAMDGRMARECIHWAKDVNIADDDRSRRYYLIDSPGLLSIFTKELMETEILLNQVADNIIDIGRHGTTTGNYFVNLEEAGKDILPAEKVSYFKEDIMQLMYGSEAVSDIDLTDEGEFDVNFYLAYTPNYEPWKQETEEYGEDWPQQEPLPERTNKPSVMAQLKENMKAAEQGAEAGKMTPKRTTEREI